MYGTFICQLHRHAVHTASKTTKFVNAVGMQPHGSLLAPQRPHECKFRSAYHKFC